MLFNPGQVIHCMAYITGNVKITSSRMRYWNNELVLGSGLDLMFKSCSLRRECHWCYAHVWPWKQFIIISISSLSIACDFHWRWYKVLYKASGLWCCIWEHVLCIFAGRSPGQCVLHCGHAAVRRSRRDPRPRRHAEDSRTEGSSLEHWLFTLFQCHWPPIVLL